MTDNNKVIVITGASSGIGESLAKSYAKRKDTSLVLASRDIVKLARVQKDCIQLGCNQCIIIKYDASNQLDCESLIKQTLLKLKKIDLLILNAGVSYHNLFRQSKDLSVYRQMMDINFFGYMYTTYYALDQMVGQYEKTGVKAQIAVVSSVSGELGLPLRAGYCASKFAVNGFFESLRMEVPQIDFTVLMPTSVNTPMRQHSLGHSNNSCNNNDSSTNKIQFNEDESKRMSLEDCCFVIVRSIDAKRKKVVFPFSNYLATVIKPIFPNFIERMAMKKAGGSIVPQSKL
ncbi:short-chain dehydrogenase/reductase family protein [Heterostelium album PN500]|uniref:Short-chain dehydrogenase/reductase family protein n=1 Tax=Heterostelium pallidum (strain ATCC 26659 / Pp 5 / PN500) TaxID=670386 RepID=D3B630_HETP5|nr:short-chain dehydrogenase/reductase family protein [Heterostelium album PN500]EFA83328.1 short-chain dehydrogenase/reductase family protein [Heterostelium album PN500]|eukprot:XP_020435445.1 short-chain dehydrogenase/reductase family protein [Heterostelium album PN500]